MKQQINYQQLVTLLTQYNIILYYITFNTQFENKV